MTPAAVIGLDLDQWVSLALSYDVRREAQEKAHKEAEAARRRRGNHGKP